MQYQLTLSFNNGYRCGCCTHQWTEVSLHDTVEECAQAIHAERHPDDENSSREYEGYEICLVGSMTDDDASKLLSLLKEYKETHEKDRDLRKRHEEYEKVLRSTRKRLNNKIEALKRDRADLNQEAISRFEEQIDALTKDVEYLINNKPEGYCNEE